MVTTVGQRRRHGRTVFRGVVQVCSGPDMQGVPVVDMGAGGACLQLDEATAQRRVMTLRIGLGGTSAGFTVLGRVVWRQPEGDGHRVAVEFLDLLPSQQQRLREHLEAVPLARAA